MINLESDLHVRTRMPSSQAIDLNHDILLIRNIVCIECVNDNCLLTFHDVIDKGFFPEPDFTHP